MRTTTRLATRWRWLPLVAGFGLAAALVYEVVSPAEARWNGVRRQASGSASPAAARVGIEAVGTQRNRATGRPRVQEGATVKVGETFLRFVRTRDDSGIGGVCNAGFVDPKAEDEWAILWKVEIVVADVQADRTTLHVHWTRLRAARRPEQERDEVRTIVLAPAEYHTLDYVENAAGTSSPCVSLMIRISAQPILQQEQRPISVDVWTVDETAAGVARSVHQHVYGVTGEGIDFKLLPLDFAAVEGGASGRLSVNVEGTLRVVATEDRQVSVSVQAIRRTSWAGAESRGEGRVQFRAAIGDTAALLLPQPAGTLGRPGDSPGGGAAKIDLARAFAGHRLSLYVRIESVQ